MRHKENSQEVTLINGLGEWRKGRPAVLGRVWDTMGHSSTAILGVGIHLTRGGRRERGRDLSQKHIFFQG